MKENNRTIALIGTGMIASSMAVLTSGHGFKTLIFSRSQKSTDRCTGAVDGFFAQIEEKGFMTKAQTDACKSLITYVYDYASLAPAEAVFESVVEDVETKYQVYRSIEENCPDIRAICSVTSSIVPDTLAEGCRKYKDRVLVTHPFNPPHLVPYFEVCGSSVTSEEAFDYTMGLLSQLHRQPVRLNKPTKGFIGNRLQFALWREALALVEEGICDPHAVDTALMYSFCPRFTSIGIFEHFDNGGLELNAHTCRNVWPILSNATDIPDSMKKLMEEGKMGAKSPSKQGFYDWSGVDMDAYSERVSAPYWRLFDWGPETEPANPAASCKNSSGQYKPASPEDDLSDMVPVMATREILAWDKDYTVTRMTHPRGLDNPPHHHPHKQVMHILKGSGLFIRGDEELYIKAGDTVIIGPDVPHTFKYTPEETVWLEFFTPGREDFL